MKVSRREFLKTSAAAGLVVSYPGLAAMTKSPHLRFPTSPVDRLALTSYPFRAEMAGPSRSKGSSKKSGMDMLQFAKMAKEKFNIHNLNPRDNHFTSTDPHHLETLRKEVEGMGSRFVGLGLSGGQFYNPDPAVRNAAVESFKRWINIAVILGAPSVRPHPQGPEGAKPDVNAAVESLGKLADYGAKKNVVINLENDNLKWEDPFLIVKIIEKAKNPYLRALPDMGNTVSKGEYSYRGLKAMYPHAFNMSHVKDVVTEGGTVYKVDLARTFGIAKASGYKGYFSMEFDSGGGDVYAGTHRLISETLHYLS